MNWARFLLLGSTCLLAAGAHAKDAPTMKMGDGTVRGALLHAYEFTWLQCARQDNTWTAAGPLTETLVVIGDVLRLTQRGERPDGAKTKSTTYLARNSLAPLRMEQQLSAANGVVQAHTARTLGEKGYSGEAVRGDERRKLSGKVSTMMWHGSALGLPLVTLKPTRFPVTFASSMMSFDGTYRTVATLAGRETLQHEGQDIEALLVDVEWHHNESGDVYPPGPDASGGRYWLVNNPPAGFPYVPQYRTDTYLVTTLMTECPHQAAS